MYIYIYIYIHTYIHFCFGEAPSAEADGHRALAPGRSYTRWTCSYISVNQAVHKLI